MARYDAYLTYLTACALNGVRALSYVAWSNLFPLSDIYI